jgi:hypothetical protein
VHDSRESLPLLQGREPSARVGSNLGEAYGYKRLGHPSRRQGEQGFSDALYGRALRIQSASALTSKVATASNMHCNRRSHSSGANCRRSISSNPATFQRPRTACAPDFDREIRDLRLSTGGVVSVEERSKVRAEFSSQPSLHLTLPNTTGYVLDQRPSTTALPSAPRASGELSRFAYDVGMDVMNSTTSVGARSLSNIEKAMVKDRKGTISRTVVKAPLDCWWDSQRTVCRTKSALKSGVESACKQILHRSKDHQKCSSRCSRSTDGAMLDVQSENRLPLCDRGVLKTADASRQAMFGSMGSRHVRSALAVRATKNTRILCLKEREVASSDGNLRSGLQACPQSTKDSGPGMLGNAGFLKSGSLDSKPSLDSLCSKMQLSGSLASHLLNTISNRYAAQSNTDATKGDEGPGDVAANARDWDEIYFVGKDQGTIAKLQNECHHLAEDLGVTDSWCATWSCHSESLVWSDSDSSCSC